MKLKAQIIAESDLAREKMREYTKAADSDPKAEEWACYYEGMAIALNWVLESRHEENHCV